jgi:hypothetical protein
MIDLGKIAKQNRPKPIKADGGEISTVFINGKKYKVHTFTSSGTLTVETGGNFEYLIVAGGGAGGNSTGSPVTGGGGGAGGLRTGVISLLAGSVNSVVVGAPGQNSSLETIVSTRGGRGGNGVTGGTASLRAGQSGGSGGGAGGGSQFDVGTGGAGNTPATVPSQGNSGGSRTVSSNANLYYRASGGGGAGGAGETTNENKSGEPGAGLLINFNGIPTVYAAGGAAPEAGNPGINAEANTGNGGGGSANGSDGGTGGSGIVIVRYRYRYSKD